MFAQVRSRRIIHLYYKNYQYHPSMQCHEQIAFYRDTTSAQINF